VHLLRENAGKLFLAGGFIRATIAGEKISDIDMFGISKDDLMRVAKDLTLGRKGRYFETKNAITVLAPPRFPVQFITRWTFTEAIKLVESFDFTVCKAAIWAERLPDVIEEVNGETTVTKEYAFHSLASDAFYPDLAARRLVYTHPVRDEEAGGSLMRVIKFVKKGYSVQAPALAGVVGRVLGKISERGVTKNDGSFDEKWATTVITGLLREVDPLTVIDGVDFVDEHEVINNEREG
jgi:hypothetical protein